MNATDDSVKLPPGIKEMMNSAANMRARNPLNVPVYDSIIQTINDHSFEADNCDFLEMDELRGACDIVKSDIFIMNNKNKK